MIDDLVRQRGECLRDIEGKVVQSSVGGIEHNGLGGERFVEFALEDEGKGLLVEIGLVVHAIDIFDLQVNVLDLVLSRDFHVLALVHDVSAIHAHALGAVDVSVLGIAHASTRLRRVPLLVRVLKRLGLEVGQKVAIPPVSGSETRRNVR